MNDIISKQQSGEAIEAGTAYRRAYSKAKNWKAFLWSVAFILAALQLVKAFVPTLFADHYTLIFLIALGAYTLLGSVGKTKMDTWNSRGCLAQQRHDFLVLGAGREPSILEIAPSEIATLSKEQLNKHPEDKGVMETWWNIKLEEVPVEVAQIICFYSTISWEAEIRKQYHKFLWTILALSVVTPLAAAYYFYLTIPQIFIAIVAQCIPFFALVLEEFLLNNKCKDRARFSQEKCYSIWEAALSEKIDSHELLQKTEDIANQWQNYRTTVTPIFDWFYQKLRNKMEQDMIVDSNSLIEAWNKR